VNKGNHRKKKGKCILILALLKKSKTNGGSSVIGRGEMSQLKEGRTEAEEPIKISPPLKPIKYGEKPWALGKAWSRKLSRQRRKQEPKSKTEKSERKEQSNSSNSMAVR